MAKTTGATFILLVAGLGGAFLGTTTDAPGVVTWLGLVVAAAGAAHWLTTSRSSARRRESHGR